MGDDIAALIGHLNLGKADVMGYSLGAGVALQAAIRPEHMAEFWKALRGSRRDAGIDGSLRPANQFAIVPNATHYTLAVDPMLPQIVE
jgi:hypothetical protein